VSWTIPWDEQYGEMETSGYYCASRDMPLISFKQDIYLKFNIDVKFRTCYCDLAPFGLWGSSGGAGTNLKGVHLPCGLLPMFVLFL